MVNILKYNVSHIYCIGDIHGEFKFIATFIKYNKIKDSLLIFCGDIGFGFEKEEHYKQLFRKISKTCKEYNTQCVFLRGNHDDPSYFDGSKINTKWIKAVPDYTVIKHFDLNDTKQEHLIQTLLLIGGGISIDRKMRKDRNYLDAMKYARYHNITFDEAVEKMERKCYWENENITYNEDILSNLIDNGITINHICAHTTPKFCKPLNKDGIDYWCLLDKDLSNDLDSERNIATDIFNKINEYHPLISWFNGHFHHHLTEKHNGVTFFQLDMFRGSFDYIEVKPMLNDNKDIF